MAVKPVVKKVLQILPSTSNDMQIFATASLAVLIQLTYVLAM